jgi:hypothetical protein
MFSWRRAFAIDEPYNQHDMRPSYNVPDSDLPTNLKADQY